MLFRDDGYELGSLQVAGFLDTMKSNRLSSIMILSAA